MPSRKVVPIRSNQESTNASKALELLKPHPLRQRKIKWAAMCPTVDSIVAVGHKEHVYEKKINGRYFEPITTTRRHWMGLAIHGPALYACVKHGDIYRKPNRESKFHAMKGPFRPWTCITSFGPNMFAGVEDGPIYKYDLRTDSFVSIKVAKQNWASLAISNERLYGLTATGQLYDVCGSHWFPTTGCHITYLNTSYVTLNTLVAIGSDGFRLYLVDDHQNVYYWPPGEQKMVKIAELPKPCKSIVCHGTDIYLAGYPGDVFKIDVSTLIYRNATI